MNLPTHAVRDRGFTLIELLVVIIVIGVLSAIAVPVYLHQHTKAVNASLKSDMMSMARAQETCTVDNPMSRGSLVSATGPGSVTVCTGVVFTASPGNTITLYPGTYASDYGGGYCIVGRNPKSSARTVRGSDGVVFNAYYYRSAGGGAAGERGAFTTWC